MGTDKLNERQTKFVEAYEGNATEAARKAGYSGTDNVLGNTAHNLLKNPKIVNAIKQRQDKTIRPMIANREARQKFWTDTMKDDKTHISMRLKASELLGRSEADFTDKTETKVDMKVKQEIDFSKLSLEELDALEKISLKVHDS